MTENQTLTKEKINALIQLAAQASEAILSIYHNGEPLPVAFKSDDSPLTQADMLAHTILEQGLKRLTPGLPVLSEESDTIDFTTRKTWGRYWLVDPLDGTKEFVDHNGEFTVNIALIENHRPIFGLVMVPVSGDCYWGGADYGSCKRCLGGDSNISIRPLQHTEAITMVGSRRHGNTQLHAVISALESAFSTVNTCVAGSSLKFCLLAEGKADIYPRFAPTCEWDTAAGQAVLEGAGGYVVDTNLQPLHYNRKESLLNPFFYAMADKRYSWDKLLRFINNPSEEPN